MAKCKRKPDGCWQHRLFQGLEPIGGEEILPRVGFLVMRKRFKTELFAQARAAFTLVELLAIVAILAMGVLLLIPAFAHTHPNAQAAQCMNSMRQLMAAMTMFTHDNSE